MEVMHSNNVHGERDGIPLGDGALRIANISWKDTQGSADTLNRGLEFDYSILHQNELCYP